MEPTSFLPLVASVLIFLIGIGVYLPGARDRLHRLFLALCLLEAYWGFATFELLTAGRLPEAELWTRAGFLWPLICAALLHLALISGGRRPFAGGLHAEREGLPRTRSGAASLFRGALFLAIYLPAGTIAVLDLLTDRITGLPWRTATGWTVTPLYTLNGPAAVVWALAVSGIALALGAAYALSVRHRARRRLLLFVAAGIACAFASMLAIDAILPFFRTGYQEWISVGLALQSALVGYGIRELDLSRLTREVSVREILSLMPGILLLLDASGRIRSVHGSGLSSLGYAGGELVGRKARSLLASGAALSRDDLWPALERDGSVRRLRMQVRRKDGSTIAVLLSVGAIEARRGLFDDHRSLPLFGAPKGESQGTRLRRDRIIGFVCVAETAAEESRLGAPLARPLDEKELLVREAYHRIKNNLAIVGSFINLYQEQVRDPADRDIMSALKARVRSISLVHEQLYQGRDPGTIDFSTYARQLLENLRSSFMPPGSVVDVIVSIEPTALSIDRAVTLGLVLTELSTNALKYGFEGVGAGRLRVEMARSDKLYRLSFSNSGRPISDLDAESTDSLGLRLVRALVEQLDGSIELVREPETRFVITFPAEE